MKPNTVIWEVRGACTCAQSGNCGAGRAHRNRWKEKARASVRRFDRNGKRRIPFLSAMSMLSAKDNQSHSYLEIVDALRQHGAASKSRHRSALAAHRV